MVWKRSKDADHPFTSSSAAFATCLSSLFFRVAFSLFPRKLLTLADRFLSIVRIAEQVRVLSIVRIVEQVRQGACLISRFFFL